MRKKKIKKGEVVLLVFEKSNAKGGVAVGSVCVREEKLLVFLVSKGAKDGWTGGYFLLVVAGAGRSQGGAARRR